MNYQYRLGNFFTLRTNCIMNMSVNIDCKFYLNRHVELLFSHELKLLGSFSQ
jgi:hypothetical protein